MDSGPKGASIFVNTEPPMPQELTPEDIEEQPCTYLAVQVLAFLEHLNQTNKGENGGPLWQAPTLN